MRPRRLMLTTLPCALALAACNGGSNNTVSTPAPRSISIAFVAEANGTVIACDTTLAGLGTAGSDVTLEDFRFYLHDISLLNSNGDTVVLTLQENDFQHDGVTLMDFQDKADKCTGATKATHTTVTGTVPGDSGTLTGIRFTVGLPRSVNHQNYATAPSPLNIQSLFWAWQSGYKFMRLDVAPIGGITRPSDGAYTQVAWNFHLGSTDCNGDPILGDTVTCGRPNRPTVELTAFDPALDTILIDYGVLIGSSNLGQDVAGAPGCMSGLTDPECAATFAALGLDLNTGSPTTPAQTVFSVR